MEKTSRYTNVRILNADLEILRKLAKDGNRSVPSQLHIIIETENNYRELQKLGPILEGDPAREGFK